MATSRNRGRGRFARVPRRTMMIAAALAVILTVDPFGLSGVATGSARAAVPAEDRAANVADAMADLTRPEVAEATEVDEGWPALEDEEALVLPDAALPTAESKPVIVPATAAAEVELGGMQVAVAASADGTSPEEVILEVKDAVTSAASGVAGVLLEVVDTSDEPAQAGTVELSVSYESFAGLYGGDWGSRLRMVWLPDCRTDTPEIPECQPVPIDSVNDTLAQTVTAVVPVETSPAAVAARAFAAAAPGGSLSVQAGPSGSAGDWSQTNLPQSSTWGTSGNTGAFNWSYPLALPTPSTGLVPELAISYSSAVSDGRVPSANNQAGWLGEGFDLTSSYIERQYVPCSDDPGDEDARNSKNRLTGDLCWGPENATFVFKGAGSRLLKDGDVWRSKMDDGTIAELVPASGDDLEHWVVTTTDGTEYFFGREATSGAKSAWTVPVYGNDDGEPGYRAGDFSGSRRTQIWRWNLDRVQDPSGNTMTYAYETESNAYIPDYGKNYPDGDPISYIAGGRLTTIEYGTRAGTSASAPFRVRFETQNRCLTDRADGKSLCVDGESEAEKDMWLDTPGELRCKVTDTECKGVVPVFFDTTRLTRIISEARPSDSPTYKPLSTWDLTQRFVGEGDNGLVQRAANVTLRLDSIQRTAHKHAATPALTDIPLTPVEFGYKPLANRVDTGTDGHSALWRDRVSLVRTESGARISITYRTDCLNGVTPTSEAGNTRLCYRVKWTPDGAVDAEDHWFHKYVVDSTVEAGAPASVSQSVAKTTWYEYTDSADDPDDGAFWAKPTGPLIEPEDATRSDFRGFRDVVVSTGTRNGKIASTRTTYFRGTEKILTAGPSGTNSVSVEDREAYAGQVFATQTLNGPATISETVNEPGPPIPTPTDGVEKPTRIETTIAHGFTYDNDGALEHQTWTKTTNSDAGLPIRIDDRNLSAINDNTCTQVLYAPDTEFINANMRSFATETTVYATSCVGTMTSATVIRRDTAEYDDMGRAVRTRSIHPTDPTKDQLVSALEYDALGRVTKSTDAAGNVTHTAYVPDDGSQLQEVVTTSPDPDGPTEPLTGFTSTQVFNELTGMPVKTIDPNGLETTGSSDALGRVTSVRYPQHKSADYPSVEYEYHNGDNGLNGVLTRTLGADGKRQHTSVVLYDGLGRPFQQQVEATDASIQNRGRMVSKIFYDVHGRVTTRTSPLWLTNAPALKSVISNKVPHSQTTYEYDLAGRVIEEKLSNGVPGNPDHQMWITLTEYDGATTLTVPPHGGVPTATVADARGRTVELIEYARDPDTQSHITTAADVRHLAKTSTRYKYDAAGQLTTMVNPAPATGIAPAESTWSYSYDHAGRQVSAVDPDSGTSATTYDILGQVLTRTNGNGEVLAYRYDNLGRVLSVSDNTPGNPVKRATWEYDTASFSNGNPVRGQLHKSTRFVDGNAYVTSYPGYDSAYRPVKVTTTLPDDPQLKDLAGESFTTAYAYAADGQVAKTTYPQIVDGNDTTVLGKETVTTWFDGASMPSWMSGGFGWGTYVAKSVWTPEGKPLLQDLGNTYGATVTYDWDLASGRLNGVSLNRERVHGDEVQVTYHYDDAGNVTGLIDAPPSAAVVGRRDAQCFQYDGLRRLEVAWTDVDANCDRDQVTATIVGGVAPYWNEYTYDDRGNRTSLTERTGSTVTTTEYTHGTGAGPHQLSSMTKKTGATEVKTGFTWDAAGNQTTRTAADNLQTQTWDAEGELISVTGGAEDVSSVFDANGTRLVRIDETGATVYLPGGQEVFASDAGVTATRWYSFAGNTVAVRTGIGMAGVQSIMNDAHGTPMAYVHNTDWPAAVQRVRTDPFGAARSGQAGTVEGRGFLGAPVDDTGFTLLGARFYDPGTGTFLSVDPELNPGVPAQFNAYVYSGNNPMTWSDPSGRNWFADAWNNASKWVNKNQAEIGGFFAGALVTGGCLAATGGMGSVGCFVAGGAVAGAVTNVWKQAQSGKSFNVGSFVADTAFGGALGLLGPAAGAVGRFVAPVASKVVGAVANALKPAVSIVTNQIRSVASTAVRPIAQAAQRATQSFSSAGQKAASCAMNSFVPGTLVLLADGSKAAIETIAIGDEVLATDPETGETSAEPVVATVLGHGPKDLVTVTVTSPDGETGSVEATDGHPFWVADTQQWVVAEELQGGQWLQTASGTWVQIAAIQHDHREQTVYNLTVDTAHTFYAFAGDTDLLTHNCGNARQAGIYVINSAEGVYVGQSSNIARRLAEHARSGRFTKDEVANAARQEVAGGKTAREIAEQTMIDRLGGIDGLLNVVNPIGKSRFGLMPDQPYWR